MRFGLPSFLVRLCSCLTVDGRCPPWLMMLVGGIGDDTVSDTAGPRSLHTSQTDEVQSLHFSIQDLLEAIKGVPFVPYERHVALLSLPAIEEILHGTI